VDDYDAGEEPCYAGVPMSTIIEQGFGVGDVISLLWFKRSLPRYCTQFIEVRYRQYVIYSPRLVNGVIPTENLSCS
jgi:hypothetical protein